MGRSPRLLRSAFAMAVGWGALAGPRPAIAQQYEASLRSLDYAPDPLARSPRLLGMGRLTLADDLHNRITLWDFAGSPTGIAEAESLSTVEYRPAFRGSSGLRDLASATKVRERQDLSARQMRQSLETWRRAPGTTAYGLVAELATLQSDRPYSASVERRGTFTVPGLVGVVNGRVPWLKSDRFDYALRAQYGIEVQDDGYFEYFQLPQGEYLAKESAIAAAPDVFTPDRLETSTLRGGAAVAMRVTRGIKAAIGYDRARLKVISKNEGLRSTSRLDEKRPFDIGQASVVGRLGRDLEFGADGRAWRSQSEEFFYWSISAGPTAEPLTGRGKRLDREERGTSLRTRVRWARDGFELGAGFGTTFRRTIVTPWYPFRAGDRAGFNDFLDVVGFRTGADTLGLPERVRASRIEARGFEISGGGSWSLPGGRGLLGAEVHRRRDRSDQPPVGKGPSATAWDVRVGGEYRCRPALRARAGWGYGIADRDEFAADDAYRRTIATAGLGYQPEGSRWSADLGYAFEWANPDFVDPARWRGTQQQLALQLRWPI